MKTLNPPLSSGELAIGWMIAMMLSGRNNLTPDNIQLVAHQMLHHNIEKGEHELPLSIQKAARAICESANRPCCDGEGMADALTIIISHTLGGGIL